MIYNIIIFAVIYTRLNATMDITLPDMEEPLVSGGGSVLQGEGFRAVMCIATALMVFAILIIVSMLYTKLVDSMYWHNLEGTWHYEGVSQLAFGLDKVSDDKHEYNVVMSAGEEEEWKKAMVSTPWLVPEVQTIKHVKLTPLKKKGAVVRNKYLLTSTGSSGDINMRTIVKASNGCVRDMSGTVLFVMHERKDISAPK